MEEFLTTEEIANILKVNTITVRRWIHKGVLPASKFLKEYRVTKEDFEQFLEKGKLRNK